MTKLRGIGGPRVAESQHVGWVKHKSSLFLASPASWGSCSCSVSSRRSVRRAATAFPVLASRPLRSVSSSQLLLGPFRNTRFFLFFSGCHTGDMSQGYVSGPAYSAVSASMSLGCLSYPPWLAHVGEGQCQGTGPFLKDLTAFNSLSSTRPRNPHLVWEWVKTDATEHTSFHNYGLWHKMMCISEASLLKTQKTWLLNPSKPLFLPGVSKGYLKMQKPGTDIFIFCVGLSENSLTAACPEERSQSNRKYQEQRSHHY